MLDLADHVAGNYSGSVISDARGSSRQNVRIAVTRIGPDTVEVRSDYARLPVFETRLGQIMQTIQGESHVVFLYDMTRPQAKLNITIDDASWSGTRN
ncbi:hypothetical protein GC169_11605 [bacterium]|nr:hypothetical protein [bacterium]